MKKEQKKSKNLSGRSLNENELNIVFGGIPSQTDSVSANLKRTRIPKAMKNRANSI